MAVTLKRKRGAVSYKEPSSDDDISGDSDSGSGRRHRPTAPARRSNRQRNLHNDGDEATPAITAKPAATDTRASRGRARRKVSYKDASTDEDEEDPDADFQASDEEPARRAKPSRSAVASPRGQAMKRATKGKSPRKKLFGAPLKPNIPQQHAEKPAVPSDGLVPAWPRLPYHVLLQVFAYASHPLRDENMKPMPSISWLVQAARTCTAFTKPALTALYRNPPIFAMRSTRKDLVHQLISPPPGAHEDHRVMVKRLELDATQMTALTDHAHSAADLGNLIRALSTLREIDIFDPLDRPPFRGRLRRIRRWVYPPELFDALRHSDIRLQSWRWNSMFCDQGPLWMKTVHGDAAFRSLRELALTKFHPPEVVDAPTEEGVPLQPTTEELVGSALTALPNLKALSFETCGIVGGRLLPLLPVNLVSLSITNCGELLSDALGAFLVTHGANLKDLTLNYNQSLDLSFLVDLKKCCPKLETLRTDMTYYSSLTMSSDNDPLYETLLGENELPTWPTTLRTIDMQFLRNWNLTSATNFLSSLTGSAGDLPWLREITIIASVDADWRERADFRQKWTAKFKRVFARKWEPPSAHLMSLKAYREWIASSSQQKLAIHTKDLAAAAKYDPVVEAASAEDDSDAPLVSSKRDEKWGSKRLRRRSRATASYDEGTESEDSPSDHDAGNDDEHEEELVVQGRCHTVLFRIDNIRPQEEHFTEADFLDAEPSDDEEWNGNDDNDEGGYAW